MKNLFVLCIAFCCLVQSAPAQTKLTDSLITLIASTGENEQKVDLLIKLARAYTRIDMVQAAVHAERAQQLAEKLGYKKGLGAALNIQGFVLGYQGDLQGGLALLNKALEIRTSIDDQQGISGTLNNFGVLYDIHGQYEKAIKYYTQALAIVENLHDSVSVVTTLGNLAALYVQIGQYERAIECSKRAIVMMQAMNDNIGIAEEYSNIARIYIDQGKYLDALEYCLKALVIAEENNQLRTKSGLECKIGMIYKSMGNLDLALDYTLRSKKTAEQSGDKLLISESILNLAVVYEEMHRVREAVASFEQLITLSKQINNRHNLSAAYNNLANIYLKQGNPEQASKYYLKSLEIKKEIGDKRGEAITTLNVGVAYQKAGQYAEAFRWTQKAWRLGKEYGLKEVEVTALGNLAEISANQRDFKQAWEYMVTYTEQKDTLLNKEMSKQIAEMQTKYETEKKEKEIQLLKRDREIAALEYSRQRLMLYSFIGGSILLAALALVSYNRYRFKKKAEAVLQEKNLKLEEANRIIEIERDKSEQLLLNVLPPSIAARLKDKEETIADKYSEATILFADIAGFTKLSATTPPDELVRLLNDIFTRFDALTEKYGLEKIKTIGDCYMVVGGLPVNNHRHCEAVIDMAMEMIRAMEQFNAARNLSMRVRIGINTGEVVAGVIGRKKFIYDLWGDVVNTASRMESHGEPSKIHVTDAVFQAMKDKYRFEDRGVIDIKGKGQMRTYFLVGNNELSV
jgi:class 3 adenylate cyclase/tetratricopeptide (TPR) repeat protein